MKPSALALALALLLPAQSGHGAELPAGFAYLAQVAPSVRQDMRYAGADNFTGAPVPGYEAAECVLALKAAQALARVQAVLEAQGKSLVVFDCYRPARAVRHFIEWAASGGNATDPRWNPRVPRSKLIEAGYIAARSGHSSGGSLDLSFGKVDAQGLFSPADTGSAFDLFDALSHSNAGASEAAKANRQLLLSAMKRQGFVNYRREWWHFRFADEPYAGKLFDFPVTARD